MSGIFAYQFDAVAPYALDPLRTGEPKVGATLPKGKKPKTPAEEEPVKSPVKSVAGGASSLAATGLAEASAGKAASSNASAQTQLAHSRSASLSKHMALDAQADNHAAVPVTSGASVPVTTHTSGADATPPERGGFLGSLENWGSSLTNQWDHMMYSPNSGAKPADAYEQQKYNAYWHGSSKAQAPYLSTGATSGAALSGGVQGLSSQPGYNVTKDSGVTEPTNVYNPSSLYTTKQGASYVPGVSAPYSANAGSISSAESSVPAVGAGATPKAISPYDYNSEFEKMMGGNGMSSSSGGASRYVNPYQFRNSVAYSQGLAYDQELQAEIDAELEAASA
jgi:hypothetical protein